MDVLAKSWQFQRVYRQGKKINCKNALIFYLIDDETGKKPSFGFVASKRVGNAVKRNRAKRLLREVGRSISRKLLDKGVWMVFIAKRQILDAKYQDILIELESALQNDGLLDKNKLS